MLNLIYHINNSGLSLDSLAKKSGVTPDRINAFVEGSFEPTMSDIRKLSKALKLSIDFLVSDNSKYQDVNVLFRQAIKKDSEKDKADKISYIVGNAFALLKNYQVNSKLFSEFPDVENTYENARLIASKFRQIFYKGDFYSPLLNLPKLVSEELNCILFVTDLGYNVDGASAIINSIPFIFIAPRFEPRMLFTLAHELGHILAHHKNENFATIDVEISSFKSNNVGDEPFANWFASELLLPEEGLASTLKKVRAHFNISGPIGDVEIIIASRIYGVSFEVVALRCEALKLLPKGGAISLYEELIKKHQSPEKRGAELNLRERPKIEFPRVSSTLINSAINKINSGDISLGRASELLSLSMSQVVTFNSN